METDLTLSPISSSTNKTITTSTPRQDSMERDSFTIHERVTEGDRPNITLEACNESDVVLLRENNKALLSLIKRLVQSDEFEVRRVSDNKIISKGRCSLGSTNGNIYSNDEYQRLLKERDQFKAQMEKIYENCMTQYELCTTLRQSCDEIRDAYEDAAGKLKDAVKEIEEWQAKYYNVRENAEFELERASREYEALVKNNDENTKSIRMQIQKQKIDLQRKDNEISNLKKTVDQLTTLCDQLMADVEITNDSDSVCASES